MKLISKSEKDTAEIGKKLSEHLKEGDVIAFYGDLGAGKTHFVSAIAEGIGYKGETSSPTFALVNEYLGGRLPLFHFDMYRISNWEDLYSCGYFDYLEAGGVTLIEWSENIESALPEAHIRISIRTLNNNDREIIIEGVETL